MDPNSKFRVVFYDPSGHGGICHYTYQLAESLARSGVDVTVLTTQGYELAHLERNFKLKILFKKSATKAFAERLISWAAQQSLGDGSRHTTAQTGRTLNQEIRTPRFLKRWRLRFLFCRQALAFLWRRPNLIHIQWLMDRREDYIFLILLKFFGFTVVYTAHDLLPNTNASTDDYRLLKRIYRKVDAIIVHGERSKNEIIELFSLDPDHIRVIPHGSNDLLFRHKFISKETAKSELAIDPSKKVILFFGIIKRYKGLEYLAQAFEQVRAQLDNVVLLVVGRIYDSDADGFGFYSALIERLRERQDVLCFPDYVQLEKIGLYFSASDLVVLPYTQTHTSGILLTAYAAGRPVVVTDTGSLSEAVEPGKSGLVVPPKKTEALTQAIVDLLQRSDLEEMGRYAKLLAQARYSWPKIASQTRELYQSLAT
jgi:glycosyltransferase involved in cell wall biosynthesis